MLYTGVTVKIDALHLPTTKWTCFEMRTSVRAISNKNALAKALEIARMIPAYADRVDLPEWRVDAEVSLVGAVTRRYIAGKGWVVSDACTGKPVTEAEAEASYAGKYPLTTAT